MKFSNQVMLELASRAFGLNAYYVPPHESGSIGMFWGMVTIVPEGSDEEGVRWNPLISGADTLALAKVMKFVVSFPTIAGIDYVDVTEDYFVPREKARSVRLPAVQTNEAVVALAAIIQLTKELEDAQLGIEQASYMNNWMKLFGTIDVPGFTTEEASKFLPENITLSPNVRRNYSDITVISEKTGNQFHLSYRNKDKWVLSSLSVKTKEWVQTDGICENTVYDDVGFFAKLNGKVIFQKFDLPTSDETFESLREQLQSLLAVINMQPYEIISDVGFAVAKRGRKDHPSGINFDDIKSFYE